MDFRTARVAAEPSEESRNHSEKPSTWACGSAIDSAAKVDTKSWSSECQWQLAPWIMMIQVNNDFHGALCYHMFLKHDNHSALRFLFLYSMIIIFILLLFISLCVCRWIRDMRQCFCPFMAIWCHFIFWQSRMPPTIRMAITLMSGSISILDLHVNLGNVSQIASLWRSCPFDLLTQDMLPRFAFSLLSFL